MSMLDRALAVAAVTLAAAFSPVAAQTAVPSSPPSSPAPADSVTGAAAWERLKGNTITGKVGGQPFTEFFEGGGGVKYADKDGLSTGTWAVQGSKVCFDFPDDDDRSCSTFTVTGSSGSAVDDDGTTTRFDVETGNSKGL